MKPDLAVPQEAFAQTDDNVAQRLRFWRRSIAKHKWGALGVALVVVMATAYVVFSATPIYRGTATLLLEVSKPRVVSIEEVYGGVSGNREFLQTQAEILKSRELHKKLARKLNLAQTPTDAKPADPPFKLSWLPSNLQPSNWFSSAPPPPKAAPTEQDLVDRVAGQIGAGLGIQLVRGSQLIKISFESPDPEMAAKVPNALAETYIENDLDARLQMTQRASAWISERVGGLRAKLTASEQSLQAFRERERMVDIKGMAQSGAASQVQDLSNRLQAVRQRRVEADNAYAQLQAAVKANTTLDTVPIIQRDPSVARYRDMAVESERKLYELSQRYGKEHPRIIAAEVELKAARENLRKQIDLIVASITKEFETNRVNEASLERATNEAKNTVQNINRKEFQLGQLERDVAANRQLYDMFVNRVKETNIAADIQSAPARLIDPALVPGAPVKPEKVKALTIALVVGLLLGLMLAFLLEYLDNTVKNGDDVEQKLGLPLLGVLQRLGKKVDLRRAVLSDSRSNFAESVRTIRTSVMMSDLDNPHKILLVTSSVPEEGKTTIAMNLAFAFGKVHKVCLVDADMRRPSIAKAFGMDRSTPGLSNMVAGTEVASKCMHMDKDSGVLVIPSGDVPPNPQELLASRRFSEVIKKLHELFEVVIIDSPPVQLMSDALVLSSHANAVAYVVKADSTPYQVAKGGIDRLRKVGAPVLGVVLNQLDVERADRYYGYGKYSYYGKGYEYYRERQPA